MGQDHIKTMKKMARVTPERQTRTWATTSTPKSASARRSPLSPARSSTISKAALSTSDEADSERPCETYSHQEAGRRERIVFLRVQPQIRRSLKLILTLSRCCRSGTIAVCPACGSLSLQLGWISKYHVEPFESLCCPVMSINHGKPEKKKEKFSQNHVCCYLGQNQSKVSPDRIIWIWRIDKWHILGCKKLEMGRGGKIEKEREVKSCSSRRKSLLCPPERRAWGKKCNDRNFGILWMLLQPHFQETLTMRHKWRGNERKPASFGQMTKRPWKKIIMSHEIGHKVKLPWAWLQCCDSEFACLCRSLSPLHITPSLG